MSDQEPNEMKPPFRPITQPDAPLRHSGLGIASFVMGLVGILGFIVVSAVVVSLISSSIDLTRLVDANGNPTMTEEEVIAALTPILPYVIMYPLIFVIHFVGLILGIVGLARAGYKKVFAIIGTVLNGLALLVTVLFLMISIAAGISGG